MLMGCPSHNITIIGIALQLTINRANKKRKKEKLTHIISFNELSTQNLNKNNENEVEIERQNEIKNITI
jgi:hypothetical protein